MVQPVPASAAYRDRTDSKLRAVHACMKELGTHVVGRRRIKQTYLLETCVCTFIGHSLVANTKVFRT